MTCSGLASLSASVLSRCRDTITPSITALTNAARSSASSAAIGLLSSARATPQGVGLGDVPES